MSELTIRTEVHDGLEFEIPTWDPTPTSWNASGSWLEDPVLDARLRAAILVAVPDFPRLAAEANRKVAGSRTCSTFWGSHGCDLDAEHEGLCVCSPTDGPCSVGMKWGTDNTLIVAWNGETLPSVLHRTWFR
jgi:hypothetical protein